MNGTANILETTAAWTGTYRYGINSPGCHWSFHDPKNWELAIRSKDPGKTTANFSDLATKITPLLNDLRKQLNAASGNTVAVPDSFKMLEWAASATGEQTACNNNPAVASHPSLMLNHVVTSGMVRPFRILSTFVGRHLTVQIKDLPVGSPCWFYLELPRELTLLDEYLLTFPSWFFILDDITGLPNSVRSSDELKNVVELLKSHRLLNHYTILKYIREDDHFLICVSNEVKVAPYERGALCGSIPIPGPVDKLNEKDEPALVATPEVVVTSPAVAEALDQLSRVWADRFAKSILISAPPGSGKENFATSLPFGQGRPSENFTPISLASGDLQSLLRQLYGQKREDGSIEPGLLAQATNSAIFLDEVHQPPEEGKSARPSLLRPLEANQYFPNGSNKPEEIRNVLFVLATSKPVEKLGEIPPKDFWTRMTHVVPIKHPLDFVDEKNGPTRRKVIQDLFKCFWWDRTKSFYKVEPARRNERPKDVTSLLPFQQAQAILDKAKLEDAADKFATALLKELGEKEPRRCSVRGIRSMTSRLFSIVANEIASGRDDKWQTSFETHLGAVVREIMPMALLD